MDPHELVSSDILVRNGIREPLYVTAMKYANIRVTPQMKPGHIWSLDVGAVGQPIHDWYHSVQPAAEPAAAPLLLDLQNLDFSYDGRRLVLDSVDIDIRESEMISIIGRNGAGKSTLAKLLCGFVREDSGAVFYLNQIPSSMSESPLQSAPPHQSIV